MSSLDFQDIAQGLVQGQGRTELTRCAEGQGWHSERHLAHTKEEPRGAKTWAGVTQGRGPWRLHLSQPEREGGKNDRTLNSPPNSLQNQLPLGPIHTHEAGSRYRLSVQMTDASSRIQTAEKLQPFVVTSPAALKTAHRSHTLCIQMDPAASPPHGGPRVERTLAWEGVLGGGRTSQLKVECSLQAGFASLEENPCTTPTTPRSQGEPRRAQGQGPFGLFILMQQAEPG